MNFTMAASAITLAALSTPLLALAAEDSAAGRDIRYEYAGQPYEGYYAEAADARGLVLLIHDWDGLTEYEKRRADMLVELGYSVFAADLFGAGIRPEKVEDRRQHTGELYEDRQKMRGLMQAALDTAAELGAPRDSAVAAGYCFGGAAVLELARSGAGLQGYATFHGGLGTPDGQDYSAVDAKMMVYHGTADAAVTMRDFASLAEQLEEAGVPHEMISYGGAPHAFTVLGSSRYHESADRASWASFQGFLSEAM
jgi:dienelactone hydrolase